MSEKKQVLIVDFAQPVYLPPLGTPLFWLSEKGDLPAAVKRFMKHSADPHCYDAPTASQLKLVIGYLRYFIGAPCWVGPDGAIPALRARAEKMTTVAEVDSWIAECLKFAIDPL